jgi:hypothetical protein
VIIKLSEGPQGWNLWVTEKPGDDQSPIHTATGRTKEQIQALLPAILAEETSPSKAIIDGVTRRRDPLGPMRKVAQSQALYAMFGVLDSWIEGAQHNHEALGHKGEGRGEECWRSFAPGDIRRMINDAARDLGISEFPIPGGGKEDAS